jgi:S1-C subfamily serine protease
LCRISLVILLAAGLWASDSSVRAQSIPAESLARVKAATVFLKVKTSAVNGSGSGFLIERTGKAAIVVTNAHVARPEGNRAIEISCVFHSGTHDEVSHPAVLLAADETLDLAILSVNAPGLPEPLDMSTNVELVETLPVFVFGFPFGEILSSGHRNPAITISKAAISSIRLDDDDDVSILQVDGGVNPGNSGGPIVDEKGSLVGIAVAKITGADIGFALPKSQLAAMLRGRVTAVNTSPTAGSRDNSSFNVTVGLVDPKRNIREAAILTAPKTKTGETGSEKVPGGWSPMRPDAQTHLLNRRVDQASGVVSVHRDTPGSILLFQVRLKFADGSEACTRPVELTSIGSERTGPASPFGVPGLPGAPRTADGETIEFSAPITRIVTGGAGRYLIMHFGSKSEASVFDLSARKSAMTIEAGEDALIAASRDKVVVVTPFDGMYQMWSLTKLSKERGGRMPVNGMVRAVCMGNASSGPMLVCWASSSVRGAPALYSLVTVPGFRAQLLSSQERSNLPGLPHFRTNEQQMMLRAAADGKTFGVWSANTSPQGIEVLMPGRTPGAIYQHNSAGYVIPTADNAGVCTATGYFSIDLQRKRGDYICLPSLDREHFVSITAEGLQIRDVKDARVIQSLPPLAEFKASPSPVKETLSLDERFHSAPELNLLVTVPPTDDRLILRTVSLDVKKEEKGSRRREGGEPKPDASKPDAPKDDDANPLRSWTAKSGSYRTVARLIEVDSDKVVLEKEDGTRVTVPLDKLSDADVEYAKRIAKKSHG